MVPPQETIPNRQMKMSFSLHKTRTSLDRTILHLLFVGQGIAKHMHYGHYPGFYF